MYRNTLEQIDADMSVLRKGKSIMSYMEDIGMELVEVPKMYLLSIRKMIQEQDFPDEYGSCFGKLFKKMQEKHLAASAPPMVLFHSNEYSPYGLDTEFAVPLKEYATGTKDFYPGLCLKRDMPGLLVYDLSLLKLNFGECVRKEISDIFQKGYRDICLMPCQD